MYIHVFLKADITISYYYGIPEIVYQLPVSAMPQYKKFILTAVTFYSMMTCRCALGTIYCTACPM